MEEQPLLDELRSALAHLHDVDRLGTHPLAQKVPARTASAGPDTRGLQLRMVLTELIQSLKPGEDVPESAPEWRWYVILHDRYLLRRPLYQIEEKLSLGDRQVRREHKCALEAMAAGLRQWLAASPSPTPAPPSVTPTSVEAAVHRISPVLRVFSLAQLLEEVATILRAVHRERPSDVSWAVHPANLTVYTDRGILHQLLLKLLGRLARGDGEGRVFVEAVSGPQDVQISLFSRVRPAGDDEDMRLCQWLAHALHIEMQLAQDDTPGARVRMAVPIGTSLRRVLVIDDELPTIELFRGYLAGLDYEVIAETDPEQVLRRAAEVQPDAILMDVMMPAMDGWELLQRLRLAPQLAGVPIIVCSVLDDADLAFVLGAARFLRKPVLRQHLVMTLHEVLTRPASPAPGHPG